MASGDLPVLLLGESGTGKDLLARAIHHRSRRAAGPFLNEVCAVPESLLESELFGFVRGAFTGAIEDRPGLLQLCRGGTLYLDEIGEMAPALQIRLLRVLEERRARPVGAEASVPIDLRLISSSRSSLQELEGSGTLRSDFFYRIKGEVIELPPLRRRREDIPVLVRRFAEVFSRECGQPLPEIDPELLEDLSQRDWPGNVRQLENEVRRAVLLHPGRLDRKAFPRQTDPGTPPGAPMTPAALYPLALSSSLREARHGLERALLESALKKNRGNASKAARDLGITRRYLGMLLEKHGLKPGGYPPPAP